MHFEHPEQRNHFQSIGRVDGPANMATAHGAGHEWQGGQVVHFVNGVPRRPVGQGHGFCGARDGSMFRYGFEQANARVAQKEADLAAHDEVGFEGIASLLGLLSDSMRCSGVCKAT
jgi:hypothetical protein